MGKSLLKKLEPYNKHRDICRFKYGPLDLCDCVEENLMEHIEEQDQRIEAGLKLADTFDEASKSCANKETRMSVQWCAKQLRYQLKERNSE